MDRKYRVAVIKPGEEKRFFYFDDLEAAQHAFLRLLEVGAPAQFMVVKTKKSKGEK